MKTKTISHKSIIKLTAWAVLTFGVFILLSNVTVEHIGLDKGDGLSDSGLYDSGVIGILPLSIGPANKIIEATGVSREWCLFNSLSEGNSIPGSTFEGFPAMTKATPYQNRCTHNWYYTYPTGYVINFLTAGLISLAVIYLISLVAKLKSKASPKKQS